MKKKKRHVNAFLTANKQKLDEHETVYYFMYNSHGGKSEEPNEVKYAFDALLLFAVVTFISFLFLPGNYPIYILVFLLVVYSTIFDKKEKTIFHKSIENKPFCLITSKGIRLEDKIIPWEQVYFIERKNFIPSKQTLIFHLSPERKEPIVQDLTVRSSISNKNHVILGGKYKADQLYNLIFPHWDSCSPIAKLNFIHSRLKKTYQLSETKISNTETQLTGIYKTLNISTDIKNSFPVKPINLSVQFPKTMSTFLNISQETITTKFKEMAGVKDLKIGHSTLDDGYRFLSSHPTQLQTLFTQEVVHRLERLTDLGSVKWSFGKKLKRSRLSPLKSNLQDTEDVLDTGLLDIDPQQTEYSQLEGETADTLEFNGILNPNFEQDADKVAEFMELSMELSMMFAEGLKEMDTL